MTKFRPSFHSFWILAATLMASPLAWAAPVGPLNFYSIDGCRVLDTRIYGQIASNAEPVPGGQALSVDISNAFPGQVQSQGGSTTGCPDIPANPAAVVVAIGAISPGFPVTGFPSPGFATLVPFDGSQWTNTGNAPPGANNAYFTFNSQSFSQTASVLYEQDTGIILNTTTVRVAPTAPTTWHALLYTAAQAHFTLDIVGYYAP